MASGDLVSRIYTDFRGVDFRGGEVDLRRSPDALNMWKDYRQPDRLKKCPSLEIYYKYNSNNMDGAIHSIDFCDFGDSKIPIVVSGNNAYAGEDTGPGKCQLIYSPLGEPGTTRGSTSFIFDGIWYLKTALNYIQYDGIEAKKVEGYVPTTSIKRSPKGGGEPRQDVNLLTRRRKNTFIGDGVSSSFCVDALKIDTSVPPVVTVDGVEAALASTWYSPDKKEILLAEAPPKPLTEGEANVCIEFSVMEENEWPNRARDKIELCRLATVFDNRVFFSGNPHYPNTVWHSSLDDPTYISDLDYYIEGQDDALVTAMVAGNNALWVFKGPSPEHNSIYYHTPSIDYEYGKIYPSAHSNIATGCIAKAINFNDDIVFFSDRGMEGIAGEVTTEQALGHRSSLVDAKLLAEENYKNMILEEWNGYLLVFIDNKVYLADSRAMHQVDNHYEYEWFYWELNYNVTCTRVHEGTLYVGTEDGIVYTLDGDSARNEAYWTTPADKFMHPQYLKTTNKRGCVVEGEKAMRVYVKTNKTDWEEVGGKAYGSDYGVFRIKRKKFKDIQLKFYGRGEPSYDFTLKSATLECYVGGYIKR